MPIASDIRMMHLVCAHMLMFLSPANRYRFVASPPPKKDPDVSVRSSIPGSVCKPSSVPAEWRAAIIYLDQPLPTGSSAPRRSLAARVRNATYPPVMRPKPHIPGPSMARDPSDARPEESVVAYRLLGLAGGGVFPAGDVAAAAVRSYRTFSPFPGWRTTPVVVFCYAPSGLHPTSR